MKYNFVNDYFQTDDIYKENPFNNPEEGDVIKFIQMGFISTTLIFTNGCWNFQFDGTIHKPYQPYKKPRKELLKEEIDKCQNYPIPADYLYIKGLY